MERGRHRNKLVKKAAEPPAKEAEDNDDEEESYPAGTSEEENDHTKDDDEEEPAAETPAAETPAAETPAKEAEDNDDEEESDPAETDEEENDPTARRHSTKDEKKKRKKIDFMKYSPTHALVNGVGFLFKKTSQLFIIRIRNTGKKREFRNSLTQIAKKWGTVWETAENGASVEDAGKALKNVKLWKYASKFGIYIPMFVSKFGFKPYMVRIQSR